MKLLKTFYFCVYFTKYVQNHAPAKAFLIAIKSANYWILLKFSIFKVMKNAVSFKENFSQNFKDTFFFIVLSCATFSIILI